jgi:hypothetical protein
VALSADQQAMLQLLLERGQSYGDLGDVLGTDETEVRARARAALTELAGADPDRNVGLTDYLLGQADPIGRADAVRHLKDDPEDLALAGELAQKLRLIAPEAQLPRLPGEERRPRPPQARRPALSRLPLPARLRRTPRPERASEERPGAARAHTTLTRRQTQIIVTLGSGAVLLVAVLLGITGAFGGGGSNGGAATTSSTDSGNQSIPVRLKPPNGGKASGTATFGVANGQQPFVDVTIRGLQPAPRGDAYVMWMMLTATQGYPLPTVIAVDQNGSFHDRFPISTASLPVIGRARSVNVSVAPSKTIQTVIQSALQRKRIVVRKPGTTVLEGGIGKGSRSGGGS